MTTFEEAVEKINNLLETPEDDELLVLYGLYKQSIHGNCNIPKPGMFDFKAKKKYEAWIKNYGRPAILCKKQYIEYAETLIDKYGIK